MLYCVRFEVFTAVTMKNGVFRAFKPSGVTYQKKPVFTGYCLISVPCPKSKHLLVKYCMALIILSENMSLLLYKCSSPLQL
jgi:hypothetical protein